MVQLPNMFKRVRPIIMYPAIGAAVVAVSALLYAFVALEQENNVLLSEIETTSTQLDDMRYLLEQKDEELELHKELLTNVQAELRKVGDSRYTLQAAVADATTAANIYNKLNETDKELLEKYSKIYFLNEHYVPSNLTTIPTQWTWSGGNLQIKEEVWPFLQSMLNGMKESNLNPKIASAYRSYGTQEHLKHTHTVTYGTTAANKFVADQGYSEHQLGSTVDITDGATGGLGGFDDTDEYKWLKKHAHEYGFTISYPESNSYYAYEPWHWRFVGIELATHLHNNDLYFYDMPQRDINSYLIKLFDE